MTRRLLSALAALYAFTAIGLLNCALTSWQHGASAFAAFFAGAAVLLATAIAHHGYHRDQLRDAHARISRAERPCAPLPFALAVEDRIAIELAAACCERWWTSLGAEHDCTRKDQSA
ncbi:hypothetical protein [Streptomyces sp. NPDC014806]|uniref:hypothetical protein n=1 Tax=Streptomyces sp. NPDC014806 TaxID=3364920 RepID=UPI0036FEABA5